MLVDINSIETQRIELQEKLDSQKTQLDRNKLGQFATPKYLADAIVCEALRYIDNDNIRFLDTSIGTGAFYSALLKSNINNNITCARGYEIDTHYAVPSAKLWGNENLEYRIDNFLNVVYPQDDTEKFNLIISNPPYVRHHHIDVMEKRKLNERIKCNFGLSFSGLTGLYGYFISLSALWLQKNGISVWLVPNEFLDVNYGEKIKEFLLTKVNLLRVHRFNPVNVLFQDALVTSIVVFYTTGKNNGSVQFTTGKDINAPDTKTECTNINPKDKWSTYFPRESAFPGERTSLTKSEFSPQKEKKHAKFIGDYFTVKRGIATGSNKHFILAQEEIEALNIPRQYIKSILPSPRYIKENVIEKDVAGYIGGIKNNFLLNITCAEDEIKELPSELIDYLDKIYDEIKGHYMIKNRSPWYRQEYRPVCPFLMSYMGRNGDEPFRLFYNKTEATAPNAYLMLYPKFNWQKAEQQNSGFLYLLYDKLRKITADTFVSHGRIYGGGLYKMEPKELMRVPIDDILPEQIINIVEIMCNDKTQPSLF